MNAPLLSLFRFILEAFAFGECRKEQLRQYEDSPLPVIGLPQSVQNKPSLPRPVGTPPCAIVWHEVQRVSPLFTSYRKSGKSFHSFIWWACSFLVAPQC